MSLIKYVIVIAYSDVISEAKDLFYELKDFVQVDFANDFQELFELIRKKIPHAIIFYLNKDRKSYMSDFTRLRDDLRSDRIPVYIIWSRSSQDDIVKLLKSC